MRNKTIIKSIFIGFFFFLFLISSFNTHGYLLDETEYPLGMSLFAQYDKGFLNLPYPPGNEQTLVNSFKLNASTHNIPVGNKAGYSTGSYHGGINLNSYTNTAASYGIHDNFIKPNLLGGLEDKSLINQASQSINNNFVIANESGPLPDTGGSIPNNPPTPGPTGNVPNPVVPNPAAVPRPPVYGFFDEEDDDDNYDNPTGEESVPTPEPSLIIIGAAGLIGTLLMKKHKRGASL